MPRPAPQSRPSSRRAPARSTGRRSPAARPSHVRRAGAVNEAHMVDVGAKPVTARAARARANVRFPPGLLRGLLARGGPKGPITEMARAAGVLAAKRTGELVPLCHPLALDHVEITFTPRSGRDLEITCRAACTGRTGVEMEAMVGAAIAALTVYDMTKALDPRIAVTAVELVEKHGGKSGTWRRHAPAREGVR